MMQDQIQSDTVTMLLCNHFNRSQSIGTRALHIRKLAKTMYKRSNDVGFKQALKKLYKEPFDGQVVLAIETAEVNYWRVTNGFNT